MIFLVIISSFVNLVVLVWLSIAVPTLILYAKKQNYRGSWWALYVLGLYALLAPVHHYLRQASAVQFKLSRLVSLIYQFLTIATGTEIPLNVKLGKGLYLPHTAGVILAGLTTVGDYCVICPGVVLGTNGRGQTPTIGHNVYIGANVVIVGPVEVGDNATIGAGSILTQNVPPFALVVGNPGLVVKENYQRSYHYYANEAGCE